MDTHSVMTPEELWERFGVRTGGLGRPSRVTFAASGPDGGAISGLTVVAECEAGRESEAREAVGEVLRAHGLVAAVSVERGDRGRDAGKRGDGNGHV